MLITKGKISKGDIASFKLVNGEELAGKVEEVANDYYLVNRPVIMHLTPQGLVPVAALFTSDADCTIELPKRNVIYCNRSADDFVPVYIQSTSGIAQVPAGSIIK